MCEIFITKYVQVLKYLHIAVLHSRQSCGWRKVVLQHDGTILLCFFLVLLHVVGNLEIVSKPVPGRNK